jgi:hypothetical protein
MSAFCISILEMEKSFFLLKVARDCLLKFPRFFFLSDETEFVVLNSHIFASNETEIVI